jgi:flagellar hook-associated protein 2
VATSGTFTLTFGGETTTALQYNATLQDIEDALDALDSITAVGGVTVGGTALNAAGNTTFQFVVTAGDVSMISIDAGSLTGPTTTEIAETTKGNDGWISRNSNSVNDVLSGVTLKLHDVTEVDEPVEITLSRSTSAVLGKVHGMINAYNGLVTFLEESTEYNAETKKMGILSRDIAVSLMESQARNSFIGIIDGFDETIDSFVQVSDIGLSFNGQGQMVLDTNDFNDAIAEDFTGVLELLGATKSGNSDSDTVDFYAASDKYTTAGTYHVKVKITDSAIEWAKIKLASESTWRDAETWAGNLVTFNSDFDDNGNPLYPENSLQLTVDLSTDGTYGTDENPIIVRVKQGVAGSLEDLLGTILKAYGRLDISDEVLDDKIKQMEFTIEREESRLEGVEARLIAKFARLEKTLTLLQQQYSTVNLLMTSIMGGM